MFRRKQDDFQAEIESHIEFEKHRLVTEGMNAEDAAAAARRAFGNVAHAGERFYESRRVLWFEQLAQDLRYACRSLAKSKTFTAVAILSLAFGIGANTAVFSLADAVLMKPLPVRSPDDLQILTWVRTNKVPVRSHSGYTMIDPGSGQNISGSFSYRIYQLLRDTVPQISDVVAFTRSELTVTSDGASEYAIGHFVSGNYFQGLGVQPVLGRSIVAADDAAGQPRVALLTHRYWRKRFGQDPAVLGREITVNRIPATIIGVLPPAFQGLDPGSATDVFVPISMVAESGITWYSLTTPDNWWVQVFARPRPGVSRTAAEEAARAVVGRAIEEYAGNSTPKPEAPRIILMPGARGVGGLRRAYSTSIYVLLGIVSLVLLIACTNLANLLLARAVVRQREIAVRLSIGASRWRLMRQLLTESLLLAGAGGALGLLAASPLLGIMTRLVAGAAPLGIDARLDARTLLFTFGVSVVTGIIFGLVPARRATKMDLTPALKDSRGGIGDGSPRLRLSKMLVSVQVSLSLLLLIGAALFVRTLISLSSVDPGFQSSGVLTFQTDGSRNGYREETLAQLYDRLLDKLESIPGVESAAMSHQGLIGGSVTNDHFYVPGIPPQPHGATVNLMYCSRNFLSTMRIPRTLGRDLSPGDGASAPMVTVINEAFARKHMGGLQPIGQVFYLGDNTKPASKPIHIVGVVKDALYSRVRSGVPPTAYIPYQQRLDRLRQMTFVVRTAVPPMTIAAAARRAVREVDPLLPVAEMRTQEEQIERSLSAERVFAGLASVFGLVAALLSAIGLYGVMSYTVTRRGREIGVRIALGADGADVRWLVLRDSLWMVGAGMIIGVPAALALTGLVRKLLFGVTPTDVASYGAAVLLMIIIGAAGAWVPARRASRVDPMTALRCD